MNVPDAQTSHVGALAWRAARGLSLCACAIAMALGGATVATAAQPPPGTLDPAFAGNGWTITPPGAGGVELAAAPDGSLMLATVSPTRLLRLRPDGAVDRGFGDDGRLTIGERAGAEGSRFRYFHAANIAVDGRGRVLVFGRQGRGDHEVEVSGDLRALPEINAVVFRFGADGRRDLSFGAGKGFIHSGFGLTSPYSSEVPLVSAMAGRVDSHDRPVLVAGVSSPYSGCYGKPSPLTQPRAVVRLTRSGLVDPSFGTDGVSLIEGSSSSPGLALGGDDGLVVGAGRAGDYTAHCRPGTTIYRLGRNGQRVGGFGADGSRVLQRLHLALLGRSGALILSRVKGHTLELARLGRDGRRDLGFGHNGFVGIHPPFDARVQMRPAAVDKGGRILLAGGFVGSETLRSPTHPLRHSAFVIARLLPDGRPDPSFGDHGWAITRFPRPLEVNHVRAILDHQGRLLVAGTTETAAKPAGGVLLARYLLGH